MSEEQYSRAYARILEELAAADEWLYRCRRTIARAQRSYLNQQKRAAVICQYGDAAREIRAASDACKRVALLCEKASASLGEKEEE